MPPAARVQIVDHVIHATRADRPRWQRYGLALGLTAAAVGVGLLLHPALGMIVPFIFLPAVVLASWFGGLGPGLLTTALTAGAAAILFDHNGGGLTLDWPHDVGRGATFLLTAGVISVLSEVLHEARRQQEQGLRRVERMAELQVQLDDVAIALAEALRVRQVAEIAVVQGCALLGAYAGTLAVLDESSGRLRTIYSVGYPPEVPEERVIELHSDEPLAEAVRCLTPVVVESRRASDERYPHLAPVRELTGTEAVTALPLVVQGRVLGGFGFSFREPRQFKRTDLPLLQALAYQSALALESARRYEREQEARRRAEASGERHRFVAGANACLAGSMEYKANLREVARLAVPAFAEGCLVHLRNPDGGLGLLAAFHADEHRVAALAELGARQGDGNVKGLWRAFHTGEPELLADAEPQWLARAQGPGERALVEELDLHSSLSVPVRARERSLGAFTFLTSRRGHPLADEDLALALDLAGRAAAAIDNALLFEEAQRLNRVKDEFLALLSHELRTPLGSILVWLELLRAEAIEEGAGRAVDMVHRSARQLAELIDQLLDVSRIVAGKLSVEKQTTHLLAVVEGVVEAAGPVAQAKGVRLLASLERTLEPLWADPNRLRQALSNLVLNAIKFTPQDGEVEVSLQRVGGLARIEVRDTGAGIARDLLPFIFERFRQGDTHSTRSHGGLGLGLTIAQYIADQHEGRISADSEGAGRGAVFTFDLPLRPPPTRGIAAPTVRADAAEPRSLCALRVLLVDDHDDTLRGLTLGLSASGAEVTPVSSASDALAALPQVRPHVLVSDLAMPDKDGYALISEIRRLTPEAGGQVPAVAVSAYASYDDRLRALRAGYHEHVAKPVEIAHLVATIARLASDAGVAR
jgi:signal transduction histidine kinase/CheY-like chemotaxis protein